MTRTQRILYMTIGAVGMLMMFGILFTFGASISKADGYLPGQPGYKDEAAVYDHRPSSHVKRARYDEESIRDYVSAEEMRQLKRIKRRAEARMRAERRGPVIPNRHAEKRRPVYTEDDEPRRPQYTEARVIREEDEDDRPTRKCVSAVKATSKPMLTEARALREAKRNWSMLVTEDYSGAYNDVRNAKIIRSHCKPLHEGAWRTECTFVARPCREL